MTSSLKTMLAVSCAAVLVAACSGPKEAAPQSNLAATAAPAAAATGAGTMAVASGDFGVPECDNFMKKYLACVDSKVPEAARPALKQAFEQQKAAWKQAAATPQGRSALATGCTQAEASAKQSMTPYGCQW